MKHGEVKITVNAEPFLAAMRAMAAFSEALRVQFEQMAEATGKLTRLLYPWQYELVIDDPFEWWDGSLWSQMKAIMLHEFWTNAGRPERSPGARWERRV